jgi:hypothetical protein
MAGSTPIYGLPYPQATDLVADYPALGQELAEDIESVISGLGGGLNHIATSTFSAQSSVIVTNCFSATYDSYQIRLENLTGTPGANLLFRLRTGGTSAASGYKTQKIEVVGTSVSANGSLSSTALVPMQLVTNGANSVFDLNGPFLTRATIGQGLAGYDQASASNIYIIVNSFAHGTASSYESLEVLGSSGTITGSLRIYGYKNS